MTLAWDSDADRTSYGDYLAAYEGTVRPGLLPAEAASPARGCVVGVPLGLLLWAIGVTSLYGLVALARDLAAALGRGR